MVTELEAKERMNDLLQHMWESRYKDLCDKNKVMILDALIDLIDRKRPADTPVLTKFDLMLIRDGIEELRNKEKEEAMQSIAQVFESLVERGNSEIPNMQEERSVGREQ